MMTDSFLQVLAFIPSQVSDSQRSAGSLSLLRKTPRQNLCSGSNWEAEIKLRQITAPVFASFGYYQTAQLGILMVLYCRGNIAQVFVVEGIPRQPRTSMTMNKMPFKADYFYLKKILI